MQTTMSVAFIVPVVWLAYVLRSIWAAREHWRSFTADTKAFYILFAPLLTLALDLFVISDQLFYQPATCATRRRPPR